MSFVSYCLAAFAAGEFVGAFAVLFFMGAFRLKSPEPDEEPTGDNVIELRRHE